MCTKTRHQMTYHAAKHILSLVKSKKFRGSRMGIYYCGECDAYHITSKAGRRCIAEIKL